MMNSLYIARSGLDASRYSVDITSNNIANENTEGYVKRVANLSEINYVNGNEIGSGVSFDGVTRTTSDYLYDKLVSQNSLASYYEEVDSILSNVETIFSETDSAGLSITLSNFFDSLETLRGNSSSLINQNELSTQAQSLVDNLKSLNESIDETLTNTQKELQTQIDEVNNILKQIVSLNEEIFKNIEASSNDLLDKRDSLEKELSNYANIEVNEDNGMYNLKIAGVSVIFNNSNLDEISINTQNIAQKNIYDSNTLDDSNFTDGDEISITLNGISTLTINANVSGSSENELKQQIINSINSDSNFSNYTAYLDTSNNLIIKSNIDGIEGKFDISIAVNDNEIIKNSSSVGASTSVNVSVYDENLSFSGGSLKALTQELSTETSNIYSYKKSLDDFAKAIVDFTKENNSTQIFSGVDVNTLTFNKSNISSLTSEDLENLSQLQWNENLTIGDTEETSFSEFYQNLLVSVSSNVENNSFKLESQNSIVNSLQSSYDELTKVDPDEEMINLLQFQAAYEANAKIITAVDEMLQTLLDM